MFQKDRLRSAETGATSAILRCRCFEVLLYGKPVRHAKCEMLYASWACFMLNAKCVMQFMNALCEMLYAKCVRPRPMHEFQLPRPRQLPWKLHVSQCKLDGFLTNTDEGLRVYLPLLYPVFEIRGGGVMQPPPPKCV